LISAARVVWPPPVSTEWLAKPRYIPVTAPLRGEPGRRSRGVLLSVIAQFDVGNAARYQPGPGSATWCNIFAWDATSALGCEIPHWVEAATGRPCSVGRGAELTANATLDWLRAFGKSFGWVACERSEAAFAAEVGRVAVAVHANADREKSGHIAMCVPSIGGSSLHVAQAGRRCFESEPIENGFGDHQPLFFQHE
jgi:hypothetical protein